MSEMVIQYLTDINISAASWGGGGGAGFQAVAPAGWSCSDMPPFNSWANFTLAHTSVSMLGYKQINGSEAPGIWGPGLRWEQHLRRPFKAHYSHPASLWGPGSVFFSNPIHPQMLPHHAPSSRLKSVAGIKRKPFNLSGERAAKIRCSVKLVHLCINRVFSSRQLRSLSMTCCHGNARPHCTSQLPYVLLVSLLFPLQYLWRMDDSRRLMFLSLYRRDYKLWINKRLNSCKHHGLLWQPSSYDNNWHLPLILWHVFIICSSNKPQSAS